MKKNRIIVVDLDFLKLAADNPDHFIGTERYIQASRDEWRNGTVVIYIETLENGLSSITCVAKDRRPLNVEFSSETVRYIYDEMVYPLALSVSVGNKWIRNRVFNIVTEKDNLEFLIDMVKDIVNSDEGGDIGFTYRWGSI